MIPFTWMAGGLAIAVTLSAATGFVYGVKSEKGKRVALEQGYRIAAAQAAGREGERVRMWEGAVTIAGEKYDARIKAGDNWAKSQLNRMRDAAATRDRVRSATTPEGCPYVSRPRQADLLAASREIIELARDADQDRAGLKACIEGWPR